MLMAEQRHGRYYAQELMMNEGANVREQIQDALDAGELDSGSRLDSRELCTDELPRIPYFRVRR
jgi:hypothetical protein